MTEVLLPFDVRIDFAYQANSTKPIIARSLYETLSELKAEKDRSRYVSRETLEELFDIGKREVKVAHVPVLRGEPSQKFDIEALQSFIAA